MTASNGTTRAPDDFTARQAMVRDQLQHRDITDIRVLQVMGDVPRHLFVPPEWRTSAYSDRPLPIGENQSISQPYIVALMLQHLALQGHERVLEVGTGSGYQTALLSRLVADVHSVEYFPSLADKARILLHRLGYTNVDVMVGDGGRGLPQHAPYDRVIVAAAAPQAPPPLLAQLADGGRLVIPVSTESRQELVIITKQAEMLHEQHSVRCRFVPLRGQEGWEN